MKISTRQMVWLVSLLLLVVVLVSALRNAVTGQFDAMRGDILLFLIGGVLFWIMDFFRFLSKDGGILILPLDGSLRMDVRAGNDDASE